MRASRAPVAIVVVISAAIGALTSACPSAQDAPTCVAQIVVSQPTPKPLAQSGDAAHIAITHAGAVVFDDPVLDLVGRGQSGGRVIALDAHGPTVVPAGKNFALSLTVYDSVTSTVVATGRTTFDCTAGTVNVPLYLGSANAFDAAPAPPSKFSQLVALLDGRVLALGAGAATFDPKSSTWTTLESSSSIDNFTASRLPDGRVVIVGDRAVSLFDPAHDAFSSIATLDTPREKHVAVVVDDRVFVAGGIDTDTNAALADAFFVDAAGTITPTSQPMAQARENAIGVLLQDGTVFIAGGDDGQSPLDSIEIYDPTADAFPFVHNGCSVGPGANGLCAKRTSASAAVLDDGNVLIVGGTTLAEDADHPAQSAEVFMLGTGETLFATDHDDDVTGPRSLARIACSSTPCPTLIVGAQPHRTFAIASPTSGTLHVYGGTFTDATRDLDRVPADARLVALDDGTVLAVGQTEAARFTLCEASANLACPPL